MSGLRLAGLVVLGGGTGERLGGVSKPEILIHGHSMIEWLDRARNIVKPKLCPPPNSQLGIDCESADPLPTVLVAPETVAVPESFSLVMEDPPRSGPAAGFLAGCRWLADLVERNTAAGPGRALDQLLVGLVPVDAPLSPFALPILLQHFLPVGAEDGAELGADSLNTAAGFNAAPTDAVLACAGGVRQHVLGVFRLAAVLSASAQVANRSMRRLLEKLRVETVEVPVEYTLDADTYEDLRRVRQLIADTDWVS